jgi:Fe2+ or Zn2+ uptake regulation protein
MNKKEMAHELLIKNNINVSYQRMKIMEYLIGNHNHPTVVDIYNDLKEQIPTFSKATVYNTMKLFEENNLVQSISIKEEEVRFDPDISFHGHFLCKECEKVYDFPVEIKGLKTSFEEEFNVENSYYFLKGFCPECKK